MHVLVTGGAGFIGSHTVDALLARGHRVRVLDTLEPPVHTGSRPDYLPSDAELIQGSVTDAVAVRRALKDIDAVVHLAAYQDYLTDFSHFFLTNSVGTALLYEVIVHDRLPVSRVVVASSQAIYGEGKYRCAGHGVVFPDERSIPQLEAREWDIHCPHCGELMESLWADEAAAAPHNSYALSKRDQEEIALKLGKRYDIPSVALRYSIVQGPRQSFRNAYSGALRSFAVRVLTGQQPVVYEDGQQERDYVWIDDVVRANLIALEDTRTDFQAFNVGGDRRVNVLKLAQIVCEQAGRPFSPAMGGLFRVGDTRHIVSDVTRLRALGWNPRGDQVGMVKSYLEWAALQPDLRDTFISAQANMLASGVLRKAGAPVQRAVPA